MVECTHDLPGTFVEPHPGSVAGMRMSNTNSEAFSLAMRVTTGESLNTHVKDAGDVLISPEGMRLRTVFYWVRVC